MITAKKARDLALGELNWWGRFIMKSAKTGAVKNCYDHWYSDLSEIIERVAKGGGLEITRNLVPDFREEIIFETDPNEEIIFETDPNEEIIFETDPNIEQISYTDQINMAQEAITKLVGKLQDKGFRVSFNTVVMDSEELDLYRCSAFHLIGKVDIKFEITVDWKLI